MQPKPPHVSRETRLLLTVAVVSVGILWALARLRFPERPAAPIPVGPFIAQLAAPPGYDNLATAVGALRGQVAQSLVPVRLFAAGGGAVRRVALRIGDDVGLIVMDDASRLEADAGIELVARDAVTGVAVVRLPFRALARLPVWMPRRLGEPRYFLAADAAAADAALRPVFVGALSPIDSPLWPAPIWATPAASGLTNGTFILTTEGAIAGVAVAHDGNVAIVPAPVMFGVADGLSQQASRVAGGLGIEVQAMTPDLAEATGIGGAGAVEGPDSGGAEGQSGLKGVIVAWVDPDGPSARLVQATDVIEAVGDHAIVGVEHWRARTLRLVDGEMVSLTVRRGGERRRVDVTARPPSGPRTAVARPLGLTLRRVPGIGAMVVEVERGSSAARAGLAPGDLVTHVGAVAVPSPAQVREQFASAPADCPVVVSFRRGDSHQVTALRQQW